MSSYDLSKKVYTDVPMLDEIVHAVKIIVQDVVIKDFEKAVQSETEESINEGELYVSCMDNTASIYSFTITQSLLDSVNARIRSDDSIDLDVISQRNIDRWIADIEDIPREYYDIIVDVAKKIVIDNYVEKNNYYRMLHGEPDYGMPDYYIDATDIPKKYYRNFIDPNVDNLQYIPNKLDKYYFTYYNSFVKAVLNEGHYILNPQGEYVADSPVKYIMYSSYRYEENTAERFLYNEETQTFFPNINGDYIYDEERGVYKLGPRLYIKNVDYITATNTPNYLYKLVERYLHRVSITELTSAQISILRTSGVLDILIEKTPERPYFRHLDDRAISYYDARKAEIFEILYIPHVEELVKFRFLEVYEKNRLIYLKRYYSYAFKHKNTYYDRFFALLIVGQTMADMIAEMPEWYIRRDVFDVRTCQFILEAHGVKFYKEIPLKFQIGMVRRLNQLIKYKSTTRNIYDLAEIFNVHDVTVYKHYLMKTNRIGAEPERGDIDGGPARDALTYYGEIDGGKEPEVDSGLVYPYDVDFAENDLGYDGGREDKVINYITTAEDLEQVFDMFFLKVPIGEPLDKYLNDDMNRLDYDGVTTRESDPYWDGENDHDYVKYQILQKEFTTQCTKYLSLNSSYNMSEYQMQMVFFMNMIMNSNVECNMLELTVPIINNSTAFKLKDIIILLYCFATKYYPIQLKKGQQNKVFINNRGPSTDEVVEQEYVYVGDYNTEIKDADDRYDLDVNGGSAFDYYPQVPYRTSTTPVGDKIIDIYTLDGGPAYQKMAIKPDVIDAGRVINSVVRIDYPETRDLPVLSELYGDDADGFEADEFQDFIDLDSGRVDVVPERWYSRDLVLDGGGPLWDYTFGSTDTNDAAYKRWYDEMCLRDPCFWFEEPNDHFRYPVMDTTDRLQGFNVNANLTFLQEQIGSMLHPKFEWLRGYNIREILPTKYNKPGDVEHYFEYDSYNSFPNPGTIGNLLQDISTGKYYMWNVHGYYEVRHVYEYGIQDFLIPTKYDDIYQWDDTQQLLEAYERNKQIYLDLVEEIDDCEDQDEYFVLEYVKDYLFTVKWDLSYYTITYMDEYNNYVTRRAETFQEFIENKNTVLYQFYETVMSEKDDDTRMYNIGECIDDIITAIEIYLQTDALQYAFYFVPSRSWGVLLKWLALMINFFKSYKTYMLEISTHLVMDDKAEMRATESDHMAFKRFTIDRADITDIGDEYEMLMSMEMEDPDFTDIRNDDRMYVDYEELSVIDLNGGCPTTGHYSLDFDGSPALIIVDPSYLEDAALDMDGGPQLEYRRNEELNGGKFIDVTDPMGFDLNGGFPDTVQYYYNISGGTLPRPILPDGTDINGGFSLMNIQYDNVYDGGRPVNSNVRLDYPETRDDTKVSVIYGDDADGGFMPTPGLPDGTDIDGGASSMGGLYDNVYDGGRVTRSLPAIDYPEARDNPLPSPVYGTDLDGGLVATTLPDGTDINGGTTIMTNDFDNVYDGGRVRKGLDIDYPETKYEPEVNVLYGEDIDGASQDEEDRYLDIDGGSMANLDEREYTRDHVLDGGESVQFYEMQPTNLIYDITVDGGAPYMDESFYTVQDEPIPENYDYSDAKEIDGGLVIAVEEKSYKKEDVLDGGGPILDYNYFTGEETDRIITLDGGQAEYGDEYYVEPEQPEADFDYNTAVDINGGVVDSYGEKSFSKDHIIDGGGPVLDYNVDIAEDTDGSRAKFYLNIDGGFADTASIYYNLEPESNLDDVLDDPDAEELDGGGPDANPSIEGHNLLDEGKLAEWIAEGGMPFREQYTGVFHKGTLNTEMYAQPLSEVESDFDGGPAVDVEFYIDYDGMYPYTTMNSEGDVDGGTPALNTLSLNWLDISRHIIKLFNVDENGEKYPYHSANTTQFIDLDGGEVEDKSYDDPVSTAYVNRLMKSFERKTKSKIKDIFDRAYDPYGAADEAERQAREYTDSRLRWHNMRYEDMSYLFTGTTNYINERRAASS